MVRPLDSTKTAVSSKTVSCWKRTASLNKRPKLSCKGRLLVCAIAHESVVVQIPWIRVGSFCWKISWKPFIHTVEWIENWWKKDAQETRVVPKCSKFIPLQLLLKQKLIILNSRSIENLLNKSIGSAFCFWHLSAHAAADAAAVALWRHNKQTKRLLQIWGFQN